MAKFAINAMLLPNLIQVTESISGSVVPLAMFFHRLPFKSFDTRDVNMLAREHVPKKDFRSPNSQGRERPQMMVMMLKRMNTL